MITTHTHTILLFMLLGICLCSPALAQNHNSPNQSDKQVQMSKQGGHASPLVSDKTSESNSFHSTVSFIQEEPLALLVCGFVLFAVATTIRRKRSTGGRGGNDQTPRSVET